MKRDIDLIRKIVIAVEDFPTGSVPDEIKIAGYTREQIGYHSYLIVNSGLAEGFDAEEYGNTSPSWQLLNLTSAGHDFAEAARSETNWSKAKSIVKEKGGGVTLDILKDVLIGVIKGTLGFS